ncbi:MAG: hypothetical protein MZV70_50295 [Desulfobacterales bacterium]|nr:hypothetical protein [Desulfobacterales bacterium]
MLTIRQQLSKATTSIAEVLETRKITTIPNGMHFQCDIHAPTEVIWPTDAQ